MHYNKALIYFGLEAILLLSVVSLGLFILGFLLNSLSRKLREVISRATNHDTFIYMFFPGIMIHELSHLFAAVVFLYEIVDFKLIDFSAKTGSHGHVTSRPRNTFNFLYIPHLWQSMGNLFIGIAPLIIGPAFMAIWLYYFVPGGRSFILHPSLQSLPWMSLHLLIWMYFAIATAANIELSTADLNGAWKGFGFVILGVFVVALICAFISPKLIANGFLHKYWSTLGLGNFHLKVVRPIFN